MKLGLVGYGYWGKILHKNLTAMKQDVQICETNTKLEGVVDDYTKLKVDAVFVAVPCKNHYSICKHFLNLSVPVFCEKPLSFSLEESVNLYHIANSNNTTLFVDWVFLYNQQVNKIKSIVSSKEFGALKSVSMRRLNKGPIRYDVNSLYDLSSHDLSILLHVVGVDLPINKICSKSYKTNQNSIQDDSFFGVYEIGNTICTIQSSWEHAIKDRGCVFEFERAVILWDDITQMLSIDGKPFIFHEKELPLVNSINSFLHTKQEDLIYQQKITLKIMEMLNDEIQ
jgi:predicted dehydrogenase